MDISVTVRRLPSPGMTVLGDAAKFTPGGKGANQAVAAARLGGDVRMVGAVGDDDFGRRLTEALRAEGIDDRAVRTRPGAPTGIAMITVDEQGENIITVSPGANHRVGDTELEDVANGEYDALVIGAEIPVPVIRAALKRSRTTCILNLAPAPPEAAAIVADGVDWLVVNESEAAAILGTPVEGLAGAKRGAAALITVGARNAVVTAGSHGAAVAGSALTGVPEAPAPMDAASTGGPSAGGSLAGAPSAGEPLAGEPLAGGAMVGSASAGGASGGVPADSVRTGGAGVGSASALTGAGLGTEAIVASGVPVYEVPVYEVPAFAVSAVDSVGAGDTFVGALAVTLAAGVPPLEAVRAAAAAGATAATRHGAQAAMPHPADIKAVTNLSWPLS